MKMPSRRICVYAGAHAGSTAAYGQAAMALGQALVRRGYELVYGGGSDGPMGVLADAVLAARGRVIGIIPESMSAPTFHQ